MEHAEMENGACTKWLKIEMDREQSKKDNCSSPKLFCSFPPQSSYNNPNVS